jgi:hypothetical protein
MESEKQHASPNEQRAEVLVKHIYSVLDQVSQRHTRPRHLIVQHLKKLAASGADFAVDDVWRELRKDTPHLELCIVPLNCSFPMAFLIGLTLLMEHIAIASVAVKTIIISHVAPAIVLSKCMFHCLWSNSML